MKTKNIIILFGLFFILGLAIGFGLGVDAGINAAAHFLEGLFRHIQVSSVNIDLNETAIINGLTPLLNQTAR